MLRSNRRFYGWIALAGAGLSGLAAAGCFINSYGVFLPVMCKEFGWSRAIVASGLSLGLLGLGLPAPLIGICVAKFGPRILIILGNAGLALCLAGISFVHEVWQLFVLFSLAGLIGGFGGYVVVNSVASNWFVKRRSLAMGILAAFMGIGGFIFPPLTTLLISSVGWRMSWLVLAGIALILASLVPGLIMVRNRPEDMGQSTDGASLRQEEGPKTTTGSAEVEKELAKWTMKQMLRQRATWLIAALSAAAFFIAGTMNAHQIAYLRDLGASPLLAATTVSVASASIIAGDLVYGALALRFNVRYLLVGGFALQIIALAILATVTTLSIIYLYAVLYGFAGGLISTAKPTIIGTYYGRAHFARIMGMIFPVSYVFLAAGPAVGGAVFDAFGTYRPAFIILIIFSFVGLVCAFLARQPKVPKSSQYPVTQNTGSSDVPG
jgi:MFS family permease